MGVLRSTPRTQEKILGCTCNPYFLHCLLSALDHIFEQILHYISNEIIIIITLYYYYYYYFFFFYYLIQHL